MLVTKCVRDVQELKTHASESGQMHAQHLAIFFLLQGYSSVRQSPVQNGVF